MSQSKKLKSKRVNLTWHSKLDFFWGVVVWGGGRGGGLSITFLTYWRGGGGVAASTSPLRDSSHMPNLAHFTDDSLSFLRMLLFKMVIRYIYSYLSFECMISARPPAKHAFCKKWLPTCKREKRSRNCFKFDAYKFNGWYEFQRQITSRSESPISDNFAPALTLYTLTSVCIFSKLFSIHFLRCWQGEFV